MSDYEINVAHMMFCRPRTTSYSLILLVILARGVREYLFQRNPDLCGVVAVQSIPNEAAVHPNRDHFESAPYSTAEKVRVTKLGIGRGEVNKISKRVVR
jgi:hypothetical protein